MGTGEKLIARNKKARHDFQVMEEFEAGLCLQGTEVKSLREGRVSIQEGHVQIENGEAYLVEVHIPPYSHGSDANHEPFRKRKLLLKKREIRKMDSRIKERGYTVIPLKLYFSRGLAKITIALAKGKTLYDKRETLKKKMDKRDTERALRSKR